MSKTPNIVPLPEVADHTDNIIFGNLGLPSGFDNERLLVNLRRINWLRAAAGISEVSFIGEQGGTTTHDYEVTGIDAGGTATLSGKSKKSVVPVSSGSLSFPYTGTGFGNPSATVTVNTSEINHRIRNKHGIAGEFEAKPRAKFLDLAIRRGLRQAAYDANVDSHKLMNSARFYGLFTLLGVGVGADPARFFPMITVMGPLMYNVATMKSLFEQGLFNKDGDKSTNADFWATWKDMRQSLIVGAAFDRVAVSGLILHTGRLIKARS